MKKHTKYIQIIGWTGTIMLMGAYGMNSLGFIASTGPLYAGVNILAGIFLGIRVFADRNWSNLILEIFWVLIAVITLVRYFFF